MKVSRYNYPHQLGEGVEELMEDFRRMLLGGHYILGEEVGAFEAQFAAYLGARHVRGVNTGTDALILALLALGVGVGDEVITQANTFNATVTAIRAVGATPVLVDADDHAFAISLEQLEDAVTERCRAIIPVHLYGKPAPMQPILELARSRGIAIVEDAAQAHGARLNGVRVGTLGDLGCFSFHPSKNLSAAGDGGAVATNDPDLEQQVAMRRVLGQRAQNQHVVFGLNSKLDAIQARILSHKLPRLDRWNEQRRHIAAMYRQRLNGLPLRFQSTSADEEHVYHLFQIRTDRRDGLLAELRSCGIDAVVRYPIPIHLQPAFDDLGWKPGQFPTSERLANELLCLPIRPDMTEAEVGLVVDYVHAFFSGGT